MVCICGYEGGCFSLFLVKLAFANFAYTVTKDGSSLVNGKHLDLSVTSLNNFASSSNLGKKFFNSYGWSELSEFELSEILRVVLDNPNLDEVVKPEASDLTMHRRLLHHMVCNIILPRIGKFEYLTFLDMFVLFNHYNSHKSWTFDVKSYEGYLREKEARIALWYALYSYFSYV